MPTIQIDTDAFGAGQNPADVEVALLKLLESLIQFDTTYIAANPSTPTLYTSGVRYVRDPDGVEHWRDVRACLRDGIADCKSLAAYRAAELRHQGELATMVLRRRQGGNQVIYHVQVQRADGAVEDPSSILGMSNPWDQIPSGDGPGFPVFHGLGVRGLAPQSGGAVGPAMPGRVPHGMVPPMRPILRSTVAGVWPTALRMAAQGWRR